MAIGSEKETLKRPGIEENFLFEIAGKKLRVVEFTAIERISSPFRVELSLASENEIKFEDTVGKMAVLKIVGFEADRFFEGIVIKFIQTGIKGRFRLYRAILVPDIWLLSMKRNCRIFQELKTDDIIKKVFGDAGLPADSFDFRLNEEIRSREYCVQYRESDLDFISRMLEEDGIFYFFEHKNNMNKLVFGSDTINYQPIEGESSDIEYHVLDRGVKPTECVYKFVLSSQVRSGKTTLTDYNYLKPSIKLKEFNEATVYKDLEMYDYPGKFDDENFGKKFSEIRLQESMTFQEIAEGESNTPRFTPGFTFKLTDHPNDEENNNFNKEYLLVDIIHTGLQQHVLEEEADLSINYSYTNQFIGIPSEVRFRPERKTPKSKVDGIQTAKVVGPAGEEIYTDEHGRIKVKFHWDRNETEDEKSSCWIRVSQLWAGAGWGAMHIPRVGQEVIVDFLEGDPDKPIITGRVYHATNTPPYTLPEEKTKSTLMSQTSTGGGGANELLMEDQSGKTQVVLSNAYGHKITQDEESQSLTIETRDKNSICLDDKNKNVTIQTTNAHKLQFDDENKKIVLGSTDGHSMEVDDENKKITTKTAAGHTMLFDDESKKIEITTTSGHSAVLDDDSNKISLQSVSGHHVTLDDDGDSVTIEDANGNIVKLEAGSTITIESGGDINVNAPSGKIALQAMEISLTADTKIEINAGTDLKMEGGMNLEAKGGIGAKLEGGLTCDVKGGAKTTVNGGVVMIN